MIQTFMGQIRVAQKCKAAISQIPSQSLDQVMTQANPLKEAPHIYGELLKFGIDLEDKPLF